MVDCARFLDEYSDFRDGLLAPGEHRAFEAHLAACASCARYDRVVEQGAGIFRGLPELEPSEDFAARLQHRLFHVEEEMRAPGRSASGAPTPAVLSIAAALALAAWIPALRPATGIFELPAVAARAPGAELPPLLMAGPLLAHASMLHPDAPADRDNHLLFRYNPVGVALSSPVAFNALPAN
ncbi:MAG TPA: zf-HC2 domain-containing protein [Longimicrobiaceae bacterium]|nr:zf-HC2 domain-containing protein [Longimicrobiaceae bacterium]